MENIAISREFHRGEAGSSMADAKMPRFYALHAFRKSAGPHNQ